MPSVAELLEREGRTVDLEPDDFERLIRRRDRKARNHRVAAAVLAIVIALASFAVLVHAFRNAERPATEPSPKPQGIFSDVGGWITYGNADGIWAVDPSHPSDRESRVRLSSIGGIPLEWSSDGSELLISRESWVLLSLRQRRLGEEVPSSRRGLFVLHADGTETHLVSEEVSGASFSPDGATVVFAPSLEWIAPPRLDPGIYSIEADGGVPRMLVEPSRRVHFPDQDRGFLTGMYFPAFSPDGTRIAYFDGLGDSSHSLRVVNTDGGDLRVLIDSMDAYRITNLVWSPDGKTLAFGRRSNEGVYTIGLDGSGPTLVIPYGEDPHWSPDGSRISFDRESWGGRRRHLYIADRDGTHVQYFALGFATIFGPWSPLAQPEQEVAKVSAASEGLASSSMLLLLLVGAFMALVSAAVLIRRRMGQRP